MSKNESNLSLSELKQSLINDLDNRVADRILEPANRDLLKKLINNAENKTEAISIAELGTTYKRTGFHFDKKLEKQTDTIKYFKKNIELSFVTDENRLTHKLIIGDNYDALLNLSITYKNKIDVIYIDPPYGKDDMGEFAQTNYQNAISRDNLLSMLYPRLLLAKELLTDDGVIFCSIDDKNQAYVKGLFDEVFGESNFISTLIWNKQHSQQQGIFKVYHDFILVFAKNKNLIDNITGGDGIIDAGAIKKISTSNPETEFEFPAGVRCEANDGTIFSGTFGDAEQVTVKKGKFEVRDNKTVSPMTLSAGWTQKNQMYAYFNNEDVYDTKGQKVLEFYFSSSGKLKCRKERTKITPETLLPKFGTASQATGYLESIIKDNGFNNPKPVNLIKHIINFFVNNKDEAVILDFFAGSGTTGQAVLELNKEDQGNRQFILVTNNEVTTSNPNGIAYDVTSKRLKRVMTGECYDGSKDFKWNKDHQPLGDNLDVYEIDQVSNINQAPGECAFDVIDETLYGIDKLEPKEKIKFVCENFSVTQKTIEE